MTNMYDFREERPVTVLTDRGSNGYPPTEPPAEDDTLEIRLDVSDYAEKMKGMSGKTYRTMAQSPDAQMRFLARFMVDIDGRELDEEQALSILDELSYGEIIDAYNQLQEAMQEAVSPKASGKQSRKARISTYR